jgi:hypothetical protein
VAKPDSRVRGSRALIVVAVAVMAFGTCGAGNGFVGLTEEGVAEPPRILPADASLEVIEASEALSNALARVAREAPARRALDAANIVVSGMFLVGGVLLILLRRSASWWVTQAAMANILWTCAHTTSHVWQLGAKASELRRLLRRLADSMANDPTIREESLPIDELSLTIAMRIGLALVVILAYAWVLWRVRRPDIATVLEEAERHRTAE